MTSTYSTEKVASKVQVELSSHLLKQLLKSGILHGEDFKCLNASAKQVIWQVLLTSSIDNRENNLCA